MHVRLLTVVVAALAAVIGTAPASAASTKFNPPKHYYLSLGTRLPSASSATSS